MTDRVSYSFLDWPGPLAFAHRGVAVEVPENTLPAFEAAVSMGYKYVETDVHATSDGVLVAFHNRRLDGVTDRTGVLAELSFEQVRAARVGGREPIPLLADVLGAFPDLRVNIDPKSDGAVGPLIDVVRRCNAVERVCVGSFSDRRIAQVRDALGPSLCTSLGPRAAARLRLRSFHAPTGGFVGGCAQVPVRVRGLTVVDQRLVRVSHELGMQVHVWTVDDPPEMHRLLDLGVDGLMTDRADLLRDVLVRRGEWVTA